MNEQAPQRIDEVERHFKPIERVGKACWWLFWVNAVLSLGLMFSAQVLGPGQQFAEAVFVILVITNFGLSLWMSVWLIPTAERMRRLQNLSNSFGASVSEDQTQFYYNNHFPPSLKRLAANTMENALFSKEVASRMLVWRRVKVTVYLILWLAAILLRNNSLAVITWATQVVFSGEVVAEWLRLEVLRHRFATVYSDLYTHFLHKNVTTSPLGVATSIGSFADYECAKSWAGIPLSTPLFKKLNPTLSQKWEEIRAKLKMDE